MLIHGTAFTCEGKAIRKEQRCLFFPDVQMVRYPDVIWCRHGDCGSTMRAKENLPPKE